MTAVTLSPGAVPAGRLEDGAILREPLFVAAGVVLLVLTLPTGAAMLVDDRLFQGVDIWLKPLKFQLALAIYLFTLAVYARWLPAGTIGRRWYRVYAASVVLAIAFEITVIGGAAALGTGSHFNEATRLSAGLYILMGVFAVHLTGASLVYGILIARSARAPRDAALRAGLVLGLVLTFALTVVFAGYMGQNGSHFVGGGSSDAGGVPFMGWARDRGDLRVAHFFGTHAMQVVPAFGFIAGRWLAARWAVVLTCGVAAAYAGFCVATFLQALAGRPFLAMAG